MTAGYKQHACAAARPRFALSRLHAGYTVVELVVVMVIMGILAANAMPHFFTASRFEEMGFADATATAIRHARRLALASGCDTRAQVSAAGYGIRQRVTDCYSGALTRDANRPGGGTWTAAAPNGVSVGSLDLYFDASGRPFDHATALPLTAVRTVNVGTRTITVEPNTGFVH